MKVLVEDINKPSPEELKAIYGLVREAANEAVKKGSTQKEGYRIGCEQVRSFVDPNMSAEQVGSWIMSWTNKLFRHRKNGIAPLDGPNSVPSTFKFVKGALITDIEQPLTQEQEVISILQKMPPKKKCTLTFENSQEAQRGRYYVTKYARDHNWKAEVHQIQIRYIQIKRFS